jgi:hypothetical protein
MVIPAADFQRVCSLLSDAYSPPLFITALFFWFALQLHISRAKIFDILILSSVPAFCDICDGKSGGSRIEFPIVALE